MNYFLTNRARYEMLIGKENVYNLLKNIHTEYLRWTSFNERDLTRDECAVIKQNLEAAGMTELYPFWNVVQACRAGNSDRLIKICRENFPRMDRRLCVSYYSMFLAHLQKEGTKKQQKSCQKIFEQIKKRPK